LPNSKYKGLIEDGLIDLMTALGSIILMHKDANVVERDVEFIRHLENTDGLFMYETKEDKIRHSVGASTVPSQ